MRIIRLIFRLIALTVWFILCGTCAAFSFFMRNRDHAIKRNAHIAQTWSAGILKILNIKLEINGKMPDFHGVLVVSNHTGYVDIVVHGAALGMRFAPKAEIRKWPLLGPFVGLSFPIWVDRINKVKSAETMKEYRHTLEIGIPLIVYPEGTSTDGLHGLLPFKSTPFESAVECKAPVLPVLVEYFVDPGEMNPGWYDDIAFLPHLVKFLGIREIRAKLTILDQVEPGTRNRKELAQDVRSLMLKKYNELKGTDFE